MVGTAVYHVGFTSAIHPKNLSALKPDEQHTSLPADSGASSDAISPWMWNSGMIDRLRSSGVSASVCLTLLADAHTLRWVSGTILGRDVVPDVCSTSATSSGLAKSALVEDDSVPFPSNASENVPAPRSACATSRATGTPSFAATSTDGESFPGATMSSFAPRSER